MAVAAAAQVLLQPVTLCCMSLPLSLSPFHTSLSYQLKGKKCPKNIFKETNKQTCHQLSSLGLFWSDGVYNGMLEFMQISTNFTQPWKRSEPTSHMATINNLVNSM